MNLIFMLFMYSFKSLILYTVRYKIVLFVNYVLLYPVILIYIYISSNTGCKCIDFSIISHMLK